MKLTAQQEKFAQALADGMSQADAYRTAYNASNMKDATIQNNAYKLMQNNEVATRVAALKDALASKALWTREKSVLGLANIADDGSAKPAEIIAAIKELNSMHGFNEPVKVNLNANVVGRIELVPLR
jgi:hypothetical protein